MAKSRRRQRAAPAHKSDYDGAWKDALYDQLQLFMSVFFPEEECGDKDADKGFREATGVTAKKNSRAFP